MNFKTTKRFDRSFFKISTHVQNKFYKAIDLLLHNPRHPSLGVRKMPGTEAIFECRIDIHHRFTFQIESSTYILRNIGSHDAAYRNP
ncbi:MAG: cytotoxin [Elusimicrobia bacterium]|nr:cytotoxin [Elusimicrobiota bacterium]